jgi:ATP-dependent RNA helicase RhlE
VFSRTKHGANKLTTFLEKHRITTAAIHGNKTQGARTRALADFKAGKVRVLVATDIAARGIDIEQLPQVVNLDLPNVPEDYVHRIGRTGRAGSTWQAISLVSADEIQQLMDIERLIQKLLPRELVDGYEPTHDVPESTLRPPSRPKKPKKAHTGNNDRSGENTQSRRRGPSNNGPAKPGGNRRRRPASNGNSAAPKNPQRR